MKSEKQRLSEIKNLNKGVKKMKKIIILSIILVLGISLMAFAGAEKKVTLDRVDFVVGEEDASGWAIINYTPPDEVGAVGVTVQIQVSGLLPNHDYAYRSLGVDLATFTTNSKGKGHFHANLSSDLDLDPNWEINIWNVLNNSKVLEWN